MEKYAMSSFTYENGHHSVGQEDTPQVLALRPSAHEQKKSESWRHALFAFTQNTTLHGIRFIFMDDVSVLRRLLWLGVFLLCSTLMGIQIIERIVFFHGFPVTVNVHVNFNKTLAFPAITVCNQNVFRATAATDHQLYRLFEDLYSRNGSMVTSDIAELHNVSDIPLQDLYLLTTHKKEDLIVACEWQDEKCGPNNFTEVLTDHGVCYNFNDDPSRTLRVSSTGSDFGLKLTLNVEQYEYMPGPHDAAGVKILLHHQREFPKVAELGLAIPTGTHTYVGIQLLRIQNLPQPHGTCRSQDSPYYSRYTPEACQLACMSERLSKLCGCRHMFMPHVNGQPPICTLKQYLDCYSKHIAEVKDYVRDSCLCPVPCDFLIYDPTISFASTSVYATDRLLANAASKQLHHKFLRARETTARMDPLKFNEFCELAANMRSRFTTLRVVIENDVRSRLDQQRDTLKEVYTEVDRIYSNKLYLVKWQKYHVDKNFVRARQAMEERTLMPLALGFQEFSYQVEARIWQISHGFVVPYDNVTSLEDVKSGVLVDALTEDVKTSLYVDALNLINGRIDLAERAFANYTQLYGAFFNGTPIFRYQYEKEPRPENIYVTPRPLLNVSLFHNSYAVRHSGRVGEDINNLRRALVVYRHLLDQSYLHGNVTAKEIHDNNVFFLSRGRNFYASKSSFYSETIEYPSRVLGEKIAELERRWRKFAADYHSMYDKVAHLSSNLHYLTQTILGTLEQSIAEAEDFIAIADNSSVSNITKMAVARSLTSEKVLKGISELENFFADIRSRGQSVYDEWSTLNASTGDIWRLVLHDENLEEFYQYRNMTEMLRDLPEVLEEVDGNFTKFRDVCDFRFELGNLDSLFLMAVEHMMAAMKTYIMGSALDKDFIQNNFLQLDIYYKEKSYEQITQQRAYDLFALMCDIGGSMGLFVGASVLTVCELLDLGLHKSILHLTQRMHGARR